MTPATQARRSCGRQSRAGGSTRSPHVRWAPLLSAPAAGDGYAVGTLCVIGHEPRIWTRDALSLVKDISSAVVAEITVRDNHAPRRKASSNSERRVNESRRAGLVDGVRRSRKTRRTRQGTVPRTTCDPKAVIALVSDVPLPRELAERDDESHCPLDETQACRDPRAESSLADSFFDDPISVHLLPDPSRRRDGLRRGMGRVMCREYLPHGGAGQRRHARAWRTGPSRATPEAVPLQRLRDLPTFARAFGRYLARAISVFGTAEKRQPDEDHWFLDIIGVRSGPAGRGHRLSTDPCRAGGDRRGRRAGVPRDQVRAVVGGRLFVLSVI